MVLAVSNESRVTGSIGGQPKQIYWTPDGRQIRAMPDMHAFARTNAKGLAVENGIRDANLDKGWLPAKPTELKLFCPNCDRWHDTKNEIEQCGRKQKALIAKSIRQVKKETASSDNARIAKLETDIDEIKELLKKLIER